jgi:hypothetical protein
MSELKKEEVSYGQCKSCINCLHYGLKNHKWYCQIIEDETDERHVCNKFER